MKAGLVKNKFTKRLNTFGEKWVTEKTAKAEEVEMKRAAKDFQKEEWKEANGGTLQGLNKHGEPRVSSADSKNSKQTNSKDSKSSNVKESSKDKASSKESSKDKANSKESSKSSSNSEKQNDKKL